MRPAEALAVVDEQIGPNELEGFLQALRTAPPSTPSAPAPSKSSEKEEVVTPKPSEVNYTRTEEAAEEASSQAPTPQQPPSLTSSPSSTSTTAAPPYDMSAVSPGCAPLIGTAFGFWHLITAAPREDTTLMSLKSLSISFARPSLISSTGNSEAAGRHQSKEELGAVYS